MSKELEDEFETQNKFEIIFPDHLCNLENCWTCIDEKLRRVREKLIMEGTKPKILK